MKKIVLLFSFLLPLYTFAQVVPVKEFSYVEDRKFYAGQELYGYTFVPNKGKMTSAHYSNPIPKGAVHLEITSTGLIVTERVKFKPNGIIPGVTKAPSYRLSIPRIDKTSFGYELRLVDMKNADLQGHLKIVINEDNHAVSIAFKPSPAEAERTYYLPNTPKDIIQRDSKFFTHKQDLDATSLDDYWGKTLYPFAILFDQYDYRAFKRIYPDDRITIKFEERAILKGKKEKIFQYIVVNRKDMKGAKVAEEFLVKKVKEGVLSTQNGDRKILEVYTKIEAEGLKSVDGPKIILYRTGQETLNFIDIGPVRLTMREGTRRID